MRMELICYCAAAKLIVLHFFVTKQFFDNETHYQIDYIMVKKRFSSSVNMARTRSFPGADIGNDHELVMMTFKLHLKRTKNQGHARIRFEVDKLKDPHVAEVF